MSQNGIGETGEFTRCHPSLNFFYFILIVCLTMFTTHPLFLLLSFLGACIYAILLRGKRAAHFLFGAVLPLVILMALFNLFFTHNGATVLFYLNDQRITLEAGLYGLASGVTALVTLFFSIAGVIYGLAAGAYFCAAVCGGCLGFLVFNRNPAKIFMGDTGSLALGGGLAAAAIVMKMELFLPIAGLLYVIEALSVVLQVGYFKLTKGKRLFRMAPIHHHFEKCGFREVQVVIAFWIFTAVCCFASLIII